MSLVIKGMKMPESCHKCPFVSDTTYRCKITYKSFNWGITERLSDCPLIELQPHGDLIDRDALMRKKIRSVQSGSGENFTSWTISAVSIENIRNAPTIIEAEGGN